MKNKNNFIKELIFEENFFPFLIWEKILFWGEKEIWNLIEFYLAQKYKKKSIKNSNRFKINCILWNNWWWKTRLFQKILKLKDILEQTAERKNKYWDFYNIWYSDNQTQSYFFDSKNNSLNICDTKKELLTENYERLIKQLLENKNEPLEENNIDLDIIKNLSEKKDEKYLFQEKNTVKEEDYLKSIWENPKEVLKFNNILDKNWKICDFTFLLDDFFVLSWNIKHSENYEILKETNYNRFYCNIFNRIIKSKEMYSSFLNLPNDFDTEIKFDFKNWEENYKWNYYDFLNYSDLYNSENDKNNVKDEINYNEVLKFFILLWETYLEKDKNLNDFWINKNNAKDIWLWLSELFLVMVNHFDVYMSLDDDFTKHMLNWTELMNWKKSGFSEKWLYSYKKYEDYKKSLELLHMYIKINIEIINNINLTNYYTAYKTNKSEILKIWNQIDFNLNSLLKNLENIEDNVIKNNASFDKQIYPFKDINWNEITYSNFIDKLQWSKYSSQSEYLLINLLFWYSDIDNIKVYKNKINELKNYIYYWPIYNNSDILNKEFLYLWKKELSNNIIDFIDNEFINCDIVFKNDSKYKSFSNLSAWEKTMLVRFTNIYMKIVEKYDWWKWKKDFIILIDEPDLHLHLDWQRQYIKKLIDVFSTLNNNISLHFILATHSPFIISDLPSESLILLDKNEIKKYGNKSFGANYVDLIRNWFFFENQILMGCFSQTIIWNIAELRRQEVVNKIEIENLALIEDIEKQIWDDFLRDNLLYFKVD